jgi:hypothetical protein
MIVVKNNLLKTIECCFLKRPDILTVFGRSDNTKHLNLQQISNSVMNGYFLGTKFKPPGSERKWEIRPSLTTSKSGLLSRNIQKKQQ